MRPLEAVVNTKQFGNVLFVWALCVYDTSSYVSTWEGLKVLFFFENQGLKVRSLKVHTRQVILRLNYFLFKIQSNLFE